MLVQLRVPLVGERKQSKDLVELFRPRGLGGTLVEGQAERVEQRVERVARLGLH